MQKSKGFTIIELLVVIAIIAVLTAIVLVNVTGYITKGKVAAEKGDMASIQTNAAVWFDANSTYTTFPANSTYTLPIAAATSAGASAVSNQTSATAYCVTMTLSDGTFWCTDTTGFIGAPATSTTCASGHIACN